MNITAAVVNQTNDPYQLETLTLTPLQEDEVRVRVVASGICHSDEAMRVGDGPHPFPAVFGHEGAGIVEQVGSRVRGIQPGDHVVMSYAWCGHCAYCRHGHPSHCVDFHKMNSDGLRHDGSTLFQREDGTPVTSFFYQSSFATYTNTTANNLIVVDKALDLRLMAPLACGLLTGSGTVFNALKPAPGSAMAVFGTGAVGMAAIMAAKIAGCDPIIAVDIHDQRLSLAKELGATHTINSTKAQATTAIRELTGGKGVAYALDTSGLTSVMQSALESVAIGGTFAPLAVARPELALNPMRDLIAVSRRIIGVLMGDAVPQSSIPQLIRWYQNGQFPFDKLVRFYDFADINQAQADSASGLAIKPVLIIDRSYAPAQAAG